MELSEALQLITPTVADLAAYHLTPIETEIKLNQNESPYDWPREIKQEMADFLLEREWNRYPTFIPETLKEELGALHGVDGDQVIVGNGSNEMLVTLFQSLTAVGSPVLLSVPTFTVYALLANGMGRDLKTCELKSDLTYDIDALCALSKENPTGLMIVCTPNNPTGSALTEEDVRTLLSVHKGFLVLDQAYVEFGGFNGLSLIDEFPNLIITRTFSKAMGGAGLRFGYMIGTKEIIAQINKIKLPYNISFMTEAMARILVKHHEVSDKYVTQIVEDRETLMEACRKLPFEKVFDTAANFFLVKHARHTELFEYLITQSILIRNVSSYPMLDNCLRINVGTPSENSRLIEALTSFFAKEQ